MNARELAGKLTGMEYGESMPEHLKIQARGDGLIVILGASDDLMELRGYIHDEVSCYDGGEARLTRDGLMTRECDSYECPHERRIQEKGVVVEALWCEEGDYSWTYLTDLPHSTFEVTEDGEPYCRGIVISADDLPARPSATLDLDAVGDLATCARAALERLEDIGYDTEGELDPLKRALARVTGDDNDQPKEDSQMRHSTPIVVAAAAAASERLHIISRHERENLDQEDTLHRLAFALSRRPDHPQVTLSLRVLETLIEADRAS